eukprot:scaffold3864_cov248-Pinguiococcus_pyrenoidosus.AAC.2
MISIGQTRLRLRVIEAPSRLCSDMGEATLPEQQTGTRRCCPGGFPRKASPASSKSRRQGRSGT